MKTYLKEILDKQQADRHELLLSDLPKPSLIPNLEKASKRIIENLDKGKRLLIVGDYDCDGIMATTIMFEFFIDIGYANPEANSASSVAYIVPDRFIDGYGVSKNMVDYAIDNDFDFIVTVDNGIGAFEAIEYANENGIEVILTDHHTPDKKVPNASIIVNLKYELGEFPFMEISGATVAWYLCAQINKNLKTGIDMKKWLDLVGVTVISDVMPLKSLNVALVKYAVKSIKSKKRYLFDLAFNANKRANLTATDIGFGFVPMINAVGRLDHAKNAIEILISKDKSVIKKGFGYFEETNNRRKSLTQELLSKIHLQAEEQAEAGAKAIIVKEDDLHEGIVGILAGKLAERYMRPAYVFGWNRAKQCWKGSGRTSGSIQLYDLTYNAKISCIGFGGHAGAVGVAIAKDSFDEWKNTIVKFADKLKNEDFIPVGENPIEVSLKDINSNLLDLLDQYRPFGQEFPMPQFKCKVYLSVLESFTEGLHWKCLIIDNEGFSSKAMFFHDKNIATFNGSEVDILFTPVKVLNRNGEDIDLHAKINYLGY